MNDCRGVQERLHEWVDRELDAEIAAGVDAHLGACPHCAAIARSIRGLKDLVRAKAGAVPLPERLGARVREAIALESLRGGRGRVLRIPVSRLRWLAAAALFLVALPLAVIFFAPKDLHAEVTDRAIASHGRTVLAEDQPRYQCLSKEQAEENLRDLLGMAVALPSFPAGRACLKGVSVEELGRLRLGKVFYVIDGQELSLFVIPKHVRGGTSLCCCHAGQKVHVYCTNEGGYCLTYVTALDSEAFHDLLEAALHRAIPIHRAGG